MTDKKQTGNSNSQNSRIVKRPSKITSGVEFTNQGNQIENIANQGFINDPSFGAQSSENLEVSGVSKLISTDSSGRFLQVPWIVPIYDRSVKDNPVPFSIPIRRVENLDINFSLPQGITELILHGWYAILVYVHTLDEAQGAHRRLVVIDPDSQHVIKKDFMGVAGPATPPYTFIPGFQSGCLIRYGWQIADFPLGGFHHCHLNHHWRIFPVPMRIPSGAQGKLTIERASDINKWFRFFPDDTVYLFTGLLGRRTIEIPPPFEVGANKQPIVSRNFNQHMVSVPNSESVGALGRSVVTNINLTNRNPTLVDELIFTGEYDGVYTHINWINGMISMDWVPAMLFNFLRSAGRLPGGIFVKAPSNIQVSLAQGIRTTDTGDEDAIVSVDAAAGIFGLG